MIDRRRFIGTGVAGSVGVVVGASGCAPADAPQTESSGAGGFETSFELDEVTVDQLQASSSEVENAGSSDWTVEKGTDGHYTIRLESEVSGFPVVTATGSVTGDHQATDNVITIAVASPTSFVATSRDVAGWKENEFQDAGFSFMAIWA